MEPESALTADHPKIEPPEPELQLSVCIVTYERPTILARCLHSLAAHPQSIREVIIVDASASSQELEAVAIWPGARYVHAPQLARSVTSSRNEALRWVTGTLIAFIDDDVVVRDNWATSLIAAFLDPEVDAVAGRTLNGIAGEEHYDLPVGRLLANGRLTDGFASDPGAPVEVDHGIGANMTFRRQVLAELGGFRAGYTGTALREETDMFLRVRSIGKRVVFAPAVIVDHKPAPHVHGARFDTRYKLYGRRNHVVLLARAQGIGSPALRRWILDEIARGLTTRGLRQASLRLGVTIAGLAWGAVALPGNARWSPLPPRLTDPAAVALRASLSASGHQASSP